MTIIRPSDIADLDVRRTFRNRPTDEYNWWLCLVHDIPSFLVTVCGSVLHELSERHGGADVDVVVDQASSESSGTEIVVWLERKNP